MALQDILNQQSWDQYGANPAFGDPGQKNQVQQGIDIFKQSFQNLIGRAPSFDEINNFAQQGLFSAWNAPGDLGYSDSSNLANNYIQNAFGPQVAQNQQNLQQSQLGKTQQTIQDLIQKQTAQTTSDLTNPNSPTYQSFAGMMNNLGITPSSGA